MACLIFITLHVLIWFYKQAYRNNPNFLLIHSVVVGAVHDLVFPPICHLSRKEDRALTGSLEYLLWKTEFSPNQLGLSEDFCIPMPAAVVELSSLDQRTTPLDRMTCIYDTIHQINVHIRQGVLDTYGDRGDDVFNTLLNCTFQNFFILLQVL